MSAPVGEDAALDAADVAGPGSGAPVSSQCAVVSTPCMAKPRNTRMALIPLSSPVTQLPDGRVLFERADGLTLLLEPEAAYPRS
jgi:hypothetical protein